MNLRGTLSRRRVGEKKSWCFRFWDDEMRRCTGPLRFQGFRKPSDLRALQVSLPQHVTNINHFTKS